MAAVDEKRFSALGQAWVARFDFNAMAELEERDPQGRAFFEIVAPMLVRLDDDERADPVRQLAAVKAIRMADIRAIFEQSLQSAHPGTTAEQTGEIIGELGFSEAMGVVAWAVVKALGNTSADDDATAGNAPKTRPSKPRDRKAGTSS